MLFREPIFYFNIGIILVVPNLMIAQKAKCASFHSRISNQYMFRVPLELL